MATDTPDNNTQDAPERDPFAPGSLGELVPDLWFDPEQWPDYEPEAPLDADEALERYLEWCEGRGHRAVAPPGGSPARPCRRRPRHFGHPHRQRQVAGGAGHALHGHVLRRDIYTAPIKALVSEKFFNLVELLGRDNVGMITGDVHINTEAPVICCTEEILANQALREGPACPRRSVAMDEFHFFSDTDRGWAWQVPLLTLPKTQFLLMSATLGDVTQIADHAAPSNHARCLDVTDARVRCRCRTNTR